MPLKAGKSKKIISANIAELMHSFMQSGMIGTSHPKSKSEAVRQAMAIAFSKSRKKKTSKK